VFWAECSEAPCQHAKAMIVGKLLKMPEEELCKVEPPQLRPALRLQRSRNQWVMLLLVQPQAPL